MLALLGQLSLGAAVPRTISGLDLPWLAAGEAVPICHAGTPPGDNAPSQPRHDDTDCALCPLCLALAAPAALLTPPVLLPPPAILARRVAPLPPARATPEAAVLAATYPTGPPALA